MGSLLGPLIATKADEDSIVELEKLVWHSAEEATREYFRWLTYGNPSGQSITYVIKDDSGRVVSMHIVVPLPALIKGIRSLAGISVNVVTHPDYRRKGLSSQLAQAIYTEARRSGIDFLISLPNSMSHGLFTKKSHFKDLGKPSLLVRWIDPGILLAQRGCTKIGKSLSLLKKLTSRVWSGRAGGVSMVQQVERLRELKVKELLEPVYFCLDINGPWLAWRYSERPFRKYEHAIVGEPEFPKALVVYQILKSYNRALIMEFLVSQEASLEDAQSLLDHVVKMCELAGCSSVCCLGVLNARKVDLLKKSGFWNFPFASVWRPQVVVNSFEPLPDDFSISFMEISYGALLNME